MKVAQKNLMNPNMRSVYLSDASNYLSMEHSPSSHLSDTGPEPGKHSRLNSPFTYSCRHTLGHTSHVILPCYACGAMLLYIYCFFGVFSPVDPETNDAPVIDYVTDDPVT